jgi:uncharacterized membrane protein
MDDATKLRAQRSIHTAFIVSVISKGVFAFVQMVLGATLLLMGQTTEMFSVLVQSDLFDDPGDVLPGWAQSLLHPTPEAQFFGGLYLLSHGIVKIFLVAGLLRNRLWAYPASMGVFTVFIIYQLFRYFFKTHSPWLLVITVIDTVVIGLIYYEYRRIRSHATVE